GSGRKEVDRLRRRDRLDVLRLESEQHDPLHELLLEVGVPKLGRHDLAVRHGAVRRDREPQHDLALERRVLPECSIVERIDCTLVLIEDALDLLAAARRSVVAAARTGWAGGRRNALDRALDSGGRAPGKAGAAGVAAEGRRIDAAAA